MTQCVTLPQERATTTRAVHRPPNTVVRRVCAQRWAVAAPACGELEGLRRVPRGQLLRHFTRRGSPVTRFRPRSAPSNHAGATKVVCVQSSPNGFSRAARVWLRGSAHACGANRSRHAVAARVALGMVTKIASRQHVVTGGGAQTADLCPIRFPPSSCHGAKAHEQHRTSHEHTHLRIHTVDCHCPCIACFAQQVEPTCVRLPA